MSDQDDREQALKILQQRMLAYVVDELARRAGDGSPADLSKNVTDSIDAVVRKSVSDAMTAERRIDAQAIAQQVVTMLPDTGKGASDFRRLPDSVEADDRREGGETVPPPAPPPEQESWGIAVMAVLPWLLFVIAAIVAVVLAIFYVIPSGDLKEDLSTNRRLAEGRLQLIDRNVIELQRTRALFIESKAYKDANCAVDADKKNPCLTAEKMQQVITSLQKR